MPIIAETLLSLLSHNIKSIDMSHNQLGPSGLAAVGNGLSANSCLHTLNINFCFQARPSISLSLLFFLRSVADFYFSMILR